MVCPSCDASVHLYFPAIFYANDLKQSTTLKELTMPCKTGKTLKCISLWARWCISKGTHLLWSFGTCEFSLESNASDPHDASKGSTLVVQPREFLLDWIKSSHITWCSMKTLKFRCSLISMLHLMIRRVGWGTSFQQSHHLKRINLWK